VLSYPRRQQLHRLLRAALTATGALASVLLALVATADGLAAAATLLLLFAVGLAAASCHSLHLAARNRIGAESEIRVRHTLNRLRADGWRIIHGIDWAGHGDIDHVAVAPSGFGFAIETKTRAFDMQHLARTRATAGWLARRRRRWCPGGALPVLCVVCASRLEYVQRGVLVVSLDRLLSSLLSAVQAEAG
jgi:hypothetical protein